MSSRSIASRSPAIVLSMCFVLSGCGSGSGGTPSTTVTPSTLPPLSAGNADTIEPIQFQRAGNVTAASTTPMASTGFSVIPPQIPVPETGIKQDAAKYPQDTAEKALESLAKALENGDLAYQIAWLHTPDYTQRMLEKYKSIDAAVAANQGEDKVKGRQALLESIRKMLVAKTTEKGEVNGIKWMRFKIGDEQLIQLECQKDGRWCMNPKVRAAMK